MHPTHPETPLPAEARRSAGRRDRAANAVRGRDMSEREFRAALERRGVTGYMSSPLGRVYNTAKGGFGGGACGLHKTRRDELAYVIRRIEGDPA